MPAPGYIRLRIQEGVLCPLCRRPLEDSQALVALEEPRRAGYDGVYWIAHAADLN